jgi:signal transduction histidine kinase/CheY-like chemotaxis protein
MQTASLKEFIQAVPTCTNSASLEEVVNLFYQESCDRLIIVDDHHKPLGLMHLSSILPLLLLKNVNQPTNPGTVLSETHSSPAAEQRNLTELSTTSGRKLIESVLVIPEVWSLENVQFHLQSAMPHQHWVVVNALGQSVGFLDCLRLWRFLALRRPLTVPTWNPSYLEPGQKPMNLPAMNPLIQLLEQIPLPLMLQTNEGRIVTQNAAWRQKIAEFLNPTRISQEAASILSPSVLSELQRSGRLRERHVSDGLSARSSQDNDSLTDSLEDSTDPSCQLGVDLNSCVCICPMKDGQEQVWQFVRTPLGSTPPAGLKQPVQADLSSQSATNFEFCLATFESVRDSLPFAHPVGNQVTTTPAQAATFWLVIAQDITEQQQAAKELAAKNADLIQLNRLKDEFLACISHELKTPLTAVLGLSNLLKDQHLGPLNERQMRYAQLIYQSGRHLMLIVNDILDLTQIETGQLDLVPEVVVIEAICQQALDQAKQILSLEKASDPLVEKLVTEEIEFALEISAPIQRIVADEIRLRQMLANLLSNAFKFTEPGGRVGLQVELWEGWLAFTVWDTGIGIPADKQHLIFQKFQQLENPLTRRFEGTGLGLVLTQRLARLHGGDVTFTSTEGQGSKFTLLLPPSPPWAAALDNPDAENLTCTTQHNHLLLVVESVPRFLEELTVHLTGLGYRVAIARSGTDAIEKVRRLQPAAVFLNPMLPSLSGWDVLTLLKSNSDSCSVPVIITATTSERRQAYANRADGFVNLPINLEALQQTLDRIITQPNLEIQRSLSFDPIILHLRVHGNNSATHLGDDRTLIQDMNQLLYPHQCRILEVDDIEQADLLAQVWKPDVIVLDGFIADPPTYLKQLNQYAFLSSLPLITLTIGTTQAANQIPGLLVFPCLDLSITPPHPMNPHQEASALLKVIQIAVGTHWSPRILLADFAELQIKHLSSLGVQIEACAGGGLPQSSLDWLQGVSQYVQMAQYRSFIGNSWAEVVKQIRNQGVDLLFIYLRPMPPHPLILQSLDALTQVEARPPIIVWEHQMHSSDLPQDYAALKEALAAIATQMFPGTLAMPELLEQIKQVLRSSL